VTEYSALLGVLQTQTNDLLMEEGAPARCIVHAEGTSADAKEKR
jgi:hypothetical protein